ncbi:hypothetical protein ACVG8M_004018 [Morganella morganii]|nr:hypothetical protein [Morganella morganii]NIH18376.1 hypothetical protein [Morganella morganii]
MSIERDAVEDLIEQYDDAISDRNIPLARLLKAELNDAVEAAHAEAMEAI